MAKNVEFKAKISDYDSMYKRIFSITNETPVLLKQQDIFFNIGKGRLKLRTISEEQHEIIYYNRQNLFNPKISKYFRFKIKHYHLTSKLLKILLGEKEIVKKDRYLFLKDNIRFHLDNVWDLGAFIEIEYVMARKESAYDATIKVNKLLEELEIKPDMLICNSYVDLLKENFSKNNHLDTDI